MKASAMPVALAVWLAAACGTVKIHVDPYRVVAPHSRDRFLAGVAKVDITPPPGFPLGGHSIGGRMARGYWTRLSARAFYFEDGDGRNLAMVSCELFAIPAGLHAKVARLLADGYRMPLSPQSLILAATHTHHGPAGYMSSAVFNFSGPLPGFDAELLDKLAERIADAVHRAYDDAGGAAKSAHSVALRTGYAPDLQRNRAIDAFFRDSADDTSAVIRKSVAARMSCPDAGDSSCPRYQAADPTLSVLEVLRDGRRIGLLVFFAIHSTAMTHDCPLYQSDLTGHAMSLLERDSAAAPLVAGFFNGAEGDVSPRWVAQNRTDVVNLGEKFAGAVRAALETAPAGGVEDHPRIFTSSKAFSVAPPAGDTAGLTLPGSGAGELGGAEDGRTMLYAYGWHGGVTGPNAADPKVPALDLHHTTALRILGRILGSPKNYPREIPVAVASVGEALTMAAIPTEMTTVQGLRLRRDLEAGLKRPVVIVGLANEYIGYTTTREEYGAQDYEGASTMYGPRQGEVLTNLLLKVARKPEPGADAVPRAVFDAGTRFPYRFGPEFFGERRNLAYEDLEPVMPDAENRVDDAAPRFEWSETPAADWQTYARAVAILRNERGTWTVAADDSGADVLTVLVDGEPAPSDPQRRARRIWTAIWVPVRPFDRSAVHIFRVKAPDAPDFQCSEEFHLGSVAAVPQKPVKAAPCPEGSLPPK